MRICFIEKLKRRGSEIYKEKRPYFKRRAFTHRYTHKHWMQHFGHIIICLIESMSTPEMFQV
jgi:hypothetical protein